MAEHEPSIGQSDDWYTPPEIFDALGLTFDIDPCSPGPGHWVPAHRFFTKQDDGLSQPWPGMVFMNPPFGGRNGHIPWLRRFLEHGNGIAIVRAYTSADWFHRYAIRAETMLFPRGKTKFIRPDGSVGKAPGHGIVLLGMGPVANEALARSGLGFFVPVPRSEPKSRNVHVAQVATKLDNRSFTMPYKPPEGKRVDLCNSPATARVAT